MAVWHSWIWDNEVEVVGTTYGVVLSSPLENEIFKLNCMLVWEFFCSNIAAIARWPLLSTVNCHVIISNSVGCGKFSMLSLQPLLLLSCDSACTCSVSVGNFLL